MGINVTKALVSDRSPNGSLPNFDDVQEIVVMRRMVSQLVRTAPAGLPSEHDLGTKWVSWDRLQTARRQLERQYQVCNVRKKKVSISFIFVWVFFDIIGLHNRSFHASGAVLITFAHVRILSNTQ